MIKKLIKIVIVVSLVAPTHRDIQADCCPTVCEEKCKDTCLDACTVTVSKYFRAVRAVVTGNLFVGGRIFNSSGIDITSGGGPAGPTGATGATGATGGTGSLGYGYVCNTAAEVVAAGGTVTFNTTSAPFAGVTQSATGFTINPDAAGVYLIQYQVRGTPATLNPPSALQFTVLSTGTPLPCSTYASDVQSTILLPAETEAVTGFTLVTLPANAVITLQNITHSSADTVSLAAVPVGGTTAVNASMAIIRLA